MSLEEFNALLENRLCITSQFTDEDGNEHFIFLDYSEVIISILE